MSAINPYLKFNCSTRETLNFFKMRALAILISGILMIGCATSEKPAGDNRQAVTDEPIATSPSARSGYAEVDGLRIYYQVHGDLGTGKTPLLVLHGSFMSGDAMKPFIDRFAPSRPVIAIDQRGHGRTGDFEGPLTYEKFADDAAGVLAALNVPTADVLGYSMGCTAAIIMAVRHPERVGKLVAVSGTYRRDGWYPEVLKAFEKFSPEMFAGTPLEAEYKRLSPTPDAFPRLVEKVIAQEALPLAVPEDQIRAIKGRTMIVLGDADGVMPEHALKMFLLRGGGNVEAATKGFMTEAPRARLAILPGTSHIGIMAQTELIASMVVPFLDDKPEPMPPGFF